MRLIYNILICFAAPVAALIAWLRGRDASPRERLRDRLGRPRIAPGPPTFWIHAASMGEVQAGAGLVRQLVVRYPDHRIVMTTMTTTGAARAQTLAPDRVLHAFLPYDLPFAVRGFLDRVQPRCALILETELWPNLLSECRRRRIPVIIASARISSRTAARYRRFAKLFRSSLQDVVVAAQSELDAERFKEVGANDIRVVGNLKFDLDIPDSVRLAGQQWREQFTNRFVWVAGSTHAGEEEAAIAAHRALLGTHPDALLVIVPRHPQRFGDVAKLLQGTEMRFVTRSSHIGVTAEVAALLVDTMGELQKVYAAADIAFVGGSLVPIGGHNLLEPAALCVATLCGPYMSNAPDIIEKFKMADGIVQVSDAAQLKSELLRLADDSAARKTLGDRAQKLVNDNRGALDRILALIDAKVANSPFAGS